MGGFAKRKCKCEGTTPELCVQDDEILSQFSYMGMPYKNHPDVAGDVSMVRGHHSPEETFRLAVGREAPDEPPLTVRTITAGTVRSAGFVVVHTPGRLKKSSHVSIVMSDEDSVCNPRQTWDAEVVSAFEGSFGGTDAEGE